MTLPIFVKVYLSSKIKIFCLLWNQFFFKIKQSIPMSGCLKLVYFTTLLTGAIHGVPITCIIFYLQDNDDRC